jgi:histidinol-phosphate aminotransferase
VNETALERELPKTQPLNAVRAAIRAAPNYPFTAIHAPIKLDQNESPLDFPQDLKKLALEKMLHTDWNRYPDIHADGLRQKLGAFEGWDPNGVLFAPGSNVLIYALTQVAGIGQRVVNVAPAFSLYALGAMLLGSELREFQLGPDFSLPMDAIINELRSGGPGLLYLAEPHAPTGTLHDLSQIKTILEAARDGWIVVLDEAYYQYAGRDHKQLALEYPNAVILRTFSKAWGLSGVRLGYLLAQPALATQVQKVLLPFNISALHQAVLEVALDHPQYVQSRVEETLTERERVYGALQKHPSWTVYPSQANFLLIRTPDAAAAHRALLERGVLVRRQDSYSGLTGCVRVSIGTPAENDAFIEAALEIA